MVVRTSAGRRGRRRNHRAARSRGRLRHWLLLGGGWTFVVLGVAGLFLPFLQGVLFLLIGLFLLSRVSPRMRLLRQRLRQRYPRLGRQMDEAHAWWQRASQRLRARWRQAFR